MSIIQVSDLTFSYDGSYVPIFEKVNFHMDTAWRLGLIGRNGRGKTTLLRLLLGELPYEGCIVSSVPFTYFPYPVKDPGQSAGALLERLCPGVADWEILRELGLLRVEEGVLERPFEELSSGEQTKVLLASMFLGEERFLLLDEPTNHLDADARDAVADYLRRKKGFILVSHDRALLDGCTDHTLSINKADIEVRKGNYSTWREARDRQDQYEQAEQDKLRGEVKRLEAAGRRNESWSDRLEATKYGSRNSGIRPDRGYIGHKSAKMMKRAKVIENRQQKALEEAASLVKNWEREEPLKLHPLTHHAKTLLELRQVTIDYAGVPVCGPLDLSIHGGDRIALLGKNGSGKSSLLKLIQGEPLGHRGMMETAGGLILSYVPQDSRHLCGSLRGYAREQEVEETLFFTILRKLGFRREHLEQELSDLSDGQKKKVLIARSLCQSAHLYLWDEPLNFMDIPSRLQIEALILAHKPTLLFVEHDVAFCLAIATKQVRLDGPQDA